MKRTHADGATQVHRPASGADATNPHRADRPSRRATTLVGALIVIAFGAVGAGIGALVSPDSPAQATISEHATPTATPSLPKATGDASGGETAEVDPCQVSTCGQVRTGTGGVGIVPQG